MYVLDTDVLSALSRAEPPAEVLRWMEERLASELFTTAISRAEMLAGLAVLPAGRRREALRAAVLALFEAEFAQRVLPFDSRAADEYALVFMLRRAAGRPTGAADLMIAAIARVHGAAVVTRNASDFTGCGAPVINPWAELR
jgi:predicted nucleic acid-binding protein